MGKMHESIMRGLTEALDDAKQDANGIGILHYNLNKNCYGIWKNDRWIVDGLSHGTSLVVYVNGEWKEDTIKIKTYDEWYLVSNSKKGSELEGIHVKY